MLCLVASSKYPEPEKQTQMSNMEWDKIRKRELAQTSETSWIYEGPPPSKGGYSRYMGSACKPISIEDDPDEDDDHLFHSGGCPILDPPKQ
jgi:hypothetical protein